MTQGKSRGVWDASECALLLIDHQELIPSYFDEVAALKKPPQIRGPAGLTPTNQRSKTAATAAA
jgi:hypothetical protein